MRKTLTIVLAIAISGCGQEEQAPNENTLHNCGVTHYDSTDQSFRFNCGMSDEDTDLIQDLALVTLPKKMTCDVAVSQSGQPEYLNCTKTPENIDSFIARGATLDANWACSGLDGYGGYTDDEASHLVLTKDGTFQLLLDAKQNSDSVWYVSDSVISGDYDINSSNGLILMPNNWDSKVISASGLILSDAPKFMLVKPLLINIRELTSTTLKGMGEWLGDEKRGDVGLISCTKGPSNSLHQNHTETRS